MTDIDESMEVERIFLRFGSANNDEQLENCLNKYLTFVLLKLASSTEGVRKKVMELLVHVNKRVKTQQNIQLPMSQLFKQYQNLSDVPFVTNFTMIYIKMGFTRLPAEVQIKFLPELFNCCIDKSESQQSIFFHLILTSLKHIKFPSSVLENETFFIKDIPSNVKISFLNFGFDVMLLPYSNTKTISPGLSEQSQKYAFGEVNLIQDELEKIKLLILQLISCGSFDSELIGAHLIVATADPRHTVVSLAELKLKQIFSKDDWNNPVIIKKLYNLFLGTSKKEKSTDCDSALIPMLCVHG